MTISQRPSPRPESPRPASPRRWRRRSWQRLWWQRRSWQRRSWQRWPWQRCLGTVAFALAGCLGVSTPALADTSPDSPADKPSESVSAGSTAPDPAAEPASGRSGDWRWPLEGRPEPVRRFDPPGSRWGPGHRGVDLLGTRGQQVRAAGAGRVTYAGLLAGRGVVTVNHGGLRTTYEPLEVSVRVGASVRAGEPIGKLTTVQSHCAPRVCLHWGLIRGERYLDPLSLLDPGPPRLIPLDSGSAERPGRAEPGGVDAAGLARTDRSTGQAAVGGGPGSQLVDVQQRPDEPTTTATGDRGLRPEQRREDATPPAASEPGAQAAAGWRTLSNFAAPAAGALAGAVAAGLVVHLSRRNSSPAPTRPPPRTPPAHSAAMHPSSGSVVRLDAARRRLRSVA
jgi:Peptidase family M23